MSSDAPAECDHDAVDVDVGDEQHAPVAVIPGTITDASSDSSSSKPVFVFGGEGGSDGFGDNIFSPARSFSFSSSALTRASSPSTATPNTATDDSNSGRSSSKPVFVFGGEGGSDGSGATSAQGAIKNPRNPLAQSLAIGDGGDDDGDGDDGDDDGDDGGTTGQSRIVHGGNQAQSKALDDSLSDTLEIERRLTEIYRECSPLKVSNVKNIMEQYKDRFIPPEVRCLLHFLPLFLLMNLHFLSPLAL
jgi:hypothetical protein